MSGCGLDETVPEVPILHKSVPQGLSFLFMLNPYGGYKKPCMTLSTLKLGNYGTIVLVQSGHAGFSVSTVLRRLLDMISNLLTDTLRNMPARPHNCFGLGLKGLGVVALVAKP